MSATIKIWKEKPVEWETLTKAAAECRLTDFLRERDEITFLGKDGREYTVAAAKVSQTGALLALKDIPCEKPMYRKLDGSLVSWAGSDMRKELNTEILAQLPDDLVAAITPRKITQIIGGEQVITEDMLWLFSATEMFGKNSHYAKCDGPDEEQLPIFTTEADRVKNMDGETWWYFLRSPLASSSTNFAYVNNFGSGYSGSAANSIGVAFGFLIGSNI